MEKLIEEARKRVTEIARESKENYYVKNLQIYESDNGYTIGYVQNGWSTRNRNIQFGEKPLTKKQVIEIIDREEWNWKKYGKIV